MKNIDVVDNLEIIRVKVRFLGTIFGEMKECMFDKDDFFALSNYLFEIEEALIENIEKLSRDSYEKH